MFIDGIKDIYMFTFVKPQAFFNIITDWQLHKTINTHTTVRLSPNWKKGNKKGDVLILAKWVNPDFSNLELNFLLKDILKGFLMSHSKIKKKRKFKSTKD